MCHAFSSRIPHSPYIATQQPGCGCFLSTSSPPHPSGPTLHPLPLFIHSLVCSLVSTSACLNLAPSLLTGAWPLQPILPRPELDHIIPTLTPRRGPPAPHPPPHPAPGPIYTCCGIWACLPLHFLFFYPQCAQQTPITARPPTVSGLCTFIFAFVVPSAWNALSEPPSVE